MTHPLVNPTDSLERQNEKLIQISEVLMRRVEQDTDKSGAAYAQFERAAMLEDQVRQVWAVVGPPSDSSFSRCPVCNAPLDKATPELVAARAFRFSKHPDLRLSGTSRSRHSCDCE